MDQLICHLVGDYVLQTDWMAKKKTSSLFAALVHSFFYALPFVFITGLSWALFVIFSTHIVIDHFRLAGMIMRLKQWSWKHSDSSITTPPDLSLMLLIVIDNTIHLTINYFSIKYLG
jgi:hypothetical protein